MGLSFDRDALRVWLRPFRVEDAGTAPDGREAWARLRKSRLALPPTVAPEARGAVERLQTALGDDVPPSEVSFEDLVIWMNVSRPIDALLGVRPTSELVSAWLRTAFSSSDLARADAPRRLAPGAIVLREALLRASDRERHAAREEAAPLVETLSAYEAAVLLTVFPNETEWAEAIVERLGHVSAWTASILVASSLEPARARPFLAASDVGGLTTFLWRHERDALPGLLEIPGAAAFRVLERVTEPEVGAYFAACLGKKKTRAAALDYFRRWPTFAQEVLPSFSRGRSTVAKHAAEVLAQLSRASETRDEAPLDALPTVLREPLRTSPPVLSLALPEGPFSYDGPEVEVVEELPELSPEEARTWLSRLGSPQASLFVEGAKRVPPDARKQAWDAGWKGMATSEVLRRLCTELGADVIEGLLVSRSLRGFFPAILDVRSPRLAGPMAALLFSAHPEGLAATWLLRHVPEAIAGLIPLAFQPLSKRKHAPEALAFLAACGHSDALVAHAHTFGPEVRRSVEALVDPRWHPHSNWKKTLAPEVLASLPRPRLRDGRAFSLEGVQRLHERLWLASAYAPTAWVKAVEDACESASLAEHAWSLAKAWQLAGARKSDQWMLTASVYFANDETTRRLTPELQCPEVLEVLGATGTDAAVAELLSVVARVGSEGGIREAAEAALDHVAVVRGLDRPTLEETWTPAEDERDVVTLELGTHTLEVVVDGDLVPALRRDGRVLRSFPRPRASDDPEAHTLAKARWEQLREDLATFVVLRRGSLLRAMHSRRRVDAETWRRRWVAHPWPRRLARRVVFDAAGRTFRIAEDGTFANAADELVALPSDATIGVPHPLRWPDETLDAWRERFDDYAIVPFVPQLHRALRDAEPHEIVAGRVRRGPIARPADLRRLLVDLGGTAHRDGVSFRIEGGRRLRWSVAPIEGVATATLSVTKGNLEPGVDALAPEERIAWLDLLEGL